MENSRTVREASAWHDYVANGMREADARMDKLTADIVELKAESISTRIMLKNNNELTASIENNMQEMLDVFNSWKGAMKVLEALGRVAKPVGYITAVVASIATVWAAMWNGK